MFLVQFVDLFLVLFQMLPQYGVHVAADSYLTSGNVIHDFQNLAVYVAADIDTLAGGSCAGRVLPSCVRLPIEAINSSSSMSSVFTFLLPMLNAR